jgi:hypothetical protein
MEYMEGAYHQGAYAAIRQAAVQPIGRGAHQYPDVPEGD